MTQAVVEDEAVVETEAAAVTEVAVGTAVETEIGTEAAARIEVAVGTDAGVTKGKVKLFLINVNKSCNLSIPKKSNKGKFQPSGIPNLTDVNKSEIYQSQKIKTNFFYWRDSKPCYFVRSVIP